MGSRLSRARDNQQIWLDPIWALANLPEFIRDLTLRSPDDPRLYPSGAVHDADIADLVRAGGYRRFWQFALSPNGLDLAPSDYHEFAYDWRKGIAAAAEELDAVLVGLSQPGQLVTLVAHSQGGLVAARLFGLGGPGSQRVGKVVAVGCPFAGSVKTIKMIASHSGVLTEILPHDPVRTLLARMPGAYELMPSRTDPVLFTDSAGMPSTPFDCKSALAAAGFDRDLLASAEAAINTVPLVFPVPLRLIEGYGITTPVSATLAGGLKVLDGLGGDGTCPAASLLAAQGTAAGVHSSRVVFAVPFGDHGGLMNDKSVLTFLADDLRGRRTPPVRLAAEVSSSVAAPGQETLLIVETRDGQGAPLGNDAPRALLDSGADLLLTPCPFEGRARWLGRFQHPSSPSTLTITVPGVPSRFQPHPIPLFALTTTMSPSDDYRARQPLLGAARVSSLARARRTH
jgi:pimeloyl-ACP methyl ester carboxylesterase